MRFKHVGTIDIRITKEEERCGLYETPVLNALEIIKPKFDEPKKTEFERRQFSKKRDFYTIAFRDRIYKHMVQEPYILVSINSHPYAIYENNDVRKRVIRTQNFYYFVKKRNYAKYVTQALKGDERIDYIIARDQQVFDKALSLGLIEKL